MEIDEIEKLLSQEFVINNNKIEIVEPVEDAAPQIATIQTPLPQPTQTTPEKIPNQIIIDRRNKSK